MASKGNIPWNKGLTKETSEIVKIIGENNSSILTNRPSPNQKYSMDPNDWKIECDGCGNDIIYKSRGGWTNAILRKEKGSLIKCKSCCQSGVTRTEIGRYNMSMAAFNRNTNPENEASRRQGISESHKKRYKNMSDLEMEMLRKKQRLGYQNMGLKLKERQYEVISLKRKQEMKRLGADDIFKPSYNPDTIIYIEDILNKKYNTNFIHAESETGEFRIYDDLLKHSYYADAYSPELNLWIEIDEKHHNGDKCKNKDIIREQRIKEILKCSFLRIKFEEIKNGILE